MTPGTQFDDFAHLAPRLQTCLVSRWVSIERFQELPSEAHAVGLVVGHSLEGLDVIRAPHLTCGVPFLAARFVVICAALDAFREAGLVAPMAFTQHQMCRPDSTKKLWRTSWVPRGGNTPADFIAASSVIGDLLRCDVAHVFREESGVACLIFGHADLADCLRRPLEGSTAGLTGNDAGLELLRAQINGEEA